MWMNLKSNAWPSLSSCQLTKDLFHYPFPRCPFPRRLTQKKTLATFPRTGSMGLNHEVLTLSSLMPYSEEDTWFTWSIGRAKALLSCENSEGKPTTTMPFEEKSYRNATQQGKLAPSFNYIPTSYLIANSSWSLQIWVVKIKVPVLDSRFMLKIC